jgi:hypothetical protein
MGFEVGWKLYVRKLDGMLRPVDLTEAEAEQVTVVSADGGAGSTHMLAGVWTQWMRAASASADATVLALMLALRGLTEWPQVRAVSGREGSPFREL